MLRAVFVRTLEPGVTYDQFRKAWAPRPDALERLAGLIQSTELEGLYEDVFDESDL